MGVTTEQMDEKDAHPRDTGFGDGPVVLVGEPSELELSTARQTPQGRMFGVMVIPDELEVERIKMTGAGDTASRRAAQMAEVRRQFDPGHQPAVLSAENLDVIRELTNETDPRKMIQVRADALRALVDMVPTPDPEWGPIPRYAMLDIWMAVHGSDQSEEFEGFADELGYAETWARLCAMVRKLTGTEEQRNDAMTTYGSRMPRTLSGLGPIAAYNLGWREGRASAEVGFTEETMFKVQAAITALGYSGQPVLDIIFSLQNAGILFRERARDDGHGRTYDDPHDGHEYDHYAERSRAICAGGDHDAAVMWDRDAERIKVRENEARFEAREDYRASHADEPYTDDDKTTVAEEPVEDRLQRAFCNGFIEGIRRGSWGRFDHS